MTMHTLHVGLVHMHFVTCKKSRFNVGVRPIYQLLYWTAFRATLQLPLHLLLR